MNNPLRTPEDYELFLYTLIEQFPSIRRSTVTLVRRGASLARVAGELYFDHEIRLVIRERILYHHLPAIIDWYGYEIWQGREKVYWYDSQPHPNDPAPFVAQGYVVMATGPLEQRGKDVEGHVRDALKAVAFLREGRLSGQADTTRMGVLGGSFSSLILFRVLCHTDDFAAAVSVGGVSDVFLALYDTYYQEGYQPQPPFDRILMSLGRPDRHPENYVPNSAVFYAADLPPLCLVHGSQDTTVLADQSIRLADQLEALGKPCELHLYPGTGHYPGVEDPTLETADMFEKILGFFDRYLKEQ